MRERGKTPSAVCPCCVQAFVMLPVCSLANRAWSFVKDPDQVNSESSFPFQPPAFPPTPASLSLFFFFFPAHNSMCLSWTSVFHPWSLCVSDVYRKACVQFLLQIGVICANSGSCFLWIQVNVGYSLLTSASLRDLHCCCCYMATIIDELLQIFNLGILCGM